MTISATALSPEMTRVDTVKIYGQLGRYEMEPIDGFTLESIQWVTAEKVAKLGLTILSLLSIGAGIAALAVNPLLSLSIFALGVASLYTSSLIKDFDPPGENPDVPLSSAIHSHGVSGLMEKGILSLEEIRKKFRDEAKGLGLDDVVKNYGWEIFHYHVASPRDYQSQFIEHTQSWSLRRVLATYTWQVFRTGVANPHDFQTRAQIELQEHSIGKIRRQYGHEIFQFPIIPEPLLLQKIESGMRSSSLSQIDAELWGLVDLHRNKLPKALTEALTPLHRRYLWEQNQFSNAKEDIQATYLKDSATLRADLAAAKKTLEAQRDQALALATDSAARDAIEASCKNTLYECEQSSNDVHALVRKERDDKLARLAAQLGATVTALEREWAQVKAQAI